MKSGSEKFLSFLFPLLVVGMYVLGAILVLRDTLLLPVEIGPVLIKLFPFFILTVLLNFLAKKKFLHALPFLVCIGCAVLHFSDLISGIPVIAENIRNLLASSATDALTTEQKAAVSGTVHVLFYFFIALSCYSVSVRGSAFGLLASEFPFFLLMLLFPHSIRLLSALCLLLSAISMFLFVINKNIATTSDSGKGFRNTEELLENKPYSVVFSAIPVLLLAVFCLLPFFGKQENYSESLSTKRFRQTMLQTDLFETFLPYNRGLDSGSLQDKKDLAYSGETALRVKCDTEQNYLYLNGYSGAVYTKTGWKDVPKKEYSALEKQLGGIDPRNLHALYNGFSGSGDTVSTVSVCREYCDGSVFYLPNGLKTELKTIPEANVKSDTQVTTKFLNKVWDYTVEAYPSNHRITKKLNIQGTDADAIYSAYTNASNRALQNISGYFGSISSDSFSDAAKSYTAFVLDTYTQLPLETEQNAASLLIQMDLLLDGSKLDIAKTVNAVRKALNNQLQYTMEKVNIPTSSDFTTMLLSEKKAGSYKHFATAACVLLRAMHIPCRYAEGYIVLKEDYENTDESGFALIQDNHARSWIEVYDPYLFDWIPFDLSFQSEGESGSEAEDEQSGSDGDTREESSGEEDENQDNAPMDPGSTDESEDTGESTENQENQPESSGSSQDENQDDGNDTGSDTNSESAPGAGGRPDENGDQPDDGSEDTSISEPEESGMPDSQQTVEESPGIVFPWWILLLLLPVAFHFAFYGYRKYRLLKNSPYSSLFFAAGLYLKMMRFATAEQYLPSDSPSSYLERCKKASPSKEDLLFLERVQSVRFGELLQEESDREKCNALLASRYRHLISVLPFFKKILLFYLYRM